MGGSSTIIHINLRLFARPFGDVFSPTKKSHETSAIFGVLHLRHHVAVDADDVAEPRVEKKTVFLFGVSALARGKPICCHEKIEKKHGYILPFMVGF